MDTVVAGDVDTAEEARPMSAASLTFSDDEEEPDWMTQSQFAKVVFHDVADGYPNDCDLLCKFTLSASVPTVQNGDRVGLYRVPNVATHNYILYEWVKCDPKPEKMASPELQVVFKATALPKEEDFYLYQYVRADSSVLGASIPFQLRSPVSSELVAVENDDDFLVVKSNSALVSDQFKDRVKDMEKRYSDLLEVSERLNEDLQEKSESFILLDEKCKSLLHEKTSWGHLQADLAKVIEDKLFLEQKTLKAQEDLLEVQEQLQTMKEQEVELRKKVFKYDQEKAIYKEEARNMKARADDLNNMLTALAKSKDMAVEEIRNHILKQDEHSREMTSAKEELEKERSKVAELEAQLASSEESARVRHERQMATVAKVYDYRMSDADSRLAEADAKLAECEQKLAEMGRQLAEAESERSRAQEHSAELAATVENMIASEKKLKKKLKETQKMMREEKDDETCGSFDSAYSLNKLRKKSKEIRRQKSLESHEDGEKQKSGTGAIKKKTRNAQTQRGRDEDGSSTREDSLSNSYVDFESLYENGQSKIGRLEAELKEIRMELRANEISHISEIRALREDLNNLRSYPSTDASTNNLDSMVIQQALDLSSRCNATEERTSEATEDSLVLPVGYRPVVQQPMGLPHPTFRAPSPQIPISPPTQAKSPILRASNAFYGLLPQFPGSMFTQKPQPAQEAQVLNQQQLLNAAPVAVPVSAAVDFSQVLDLSPQRPPLQPEIVAPASVNRETDSLIALDNSAFDDFSDFSPLLAWASSAASGSAAGVPNDETASTTTSSHDHDSGFRLTDDGRPVASEVDPEETRLQCPLCEEFFEAGQVRELEFHVETHLATSTFCPVCQESFSLASQAEFVRHVQGHFPEDDFSLINAEDNGVISSVASAVVNTVTSTAAAAASAVSSAVSGVATPSAPPPEPRGNRSEEAGARLGNATAGTSGFLDSLLRYQLDID